MTVQKSFKRLVRARMAKTGESYAAARAQLLAGAHDHTRPGRDTVAGLLRCPDPRTDRHGLGGVVRAPRLVGCRATPPHRDRPAGGRAAGNAHPRLGCPGRGDELRALAWDACRRRAVRARRVRRVGIEDHRRAGTARSSGPSSTRAGAPRWLPDLELVERSVIEPKSARFDVEDGRTRLLVTVTPKALAKATIAAEHSRLAGPEELEQQRAFWRAALVVLKDDLERRAPSAGGGR